MEKDNKAKQGFLLAFGELFLKSGGVQKILRQRLVNNLVFFFKKQKIDFKIHEWRDRIFIETQEFTKVSKVLKNTFGIVWFSKCFFIEKADLNKIGSFVKQNYQDWVKENQTFALRLKKDASIKQRSEEIIEKIARSIPRKVNLDKPDKEIFVELRKQGCFIYFKKQKALGGLPVGSQGKVLCLISGGIDSPVAAFLMNKRGTENIWVHFHSFPLVSRASIEKTKELGQVFLKYQAKLKIYFVSFGEIQKQIKLKANPKYRVLLYRRAMLRIAQRIAKKEGCQALVTGESLGQVSSQTLNNLWITQQAIKIPILRPVIGMDKNEIIDLAQKIKTFNISIKPQEDCCTLFVSKGQTALGKLEEVKRIEKNLEIKEHSIEIFEAK
jgi:thiamine biosynthesis protein ThiI